MDNPWAELKSDPTITLYFVDLPSGLLGFCDHVTRSIWMANGLRQRQRRKVLRHELIHLQRGPVFAHWVDEEERAVELETARMMISVQALCAALRWTRDAYQLADELHVPAELVALRLQSMKHPAELAAVRVAMADVADMNAP